MTRVALRWMQHDDIEDLVKAERASNTVPGGEGWLYPWSLTADEILRVAGSEYETRAVTAAQYVGMRTPDGLTETVPWVCGGTVFEKQTTRFEIAFIILHPKCDRQSVLSAIADFVEERAKKSECRRSVAVYVRDRDEAGLRFFLPFWQARGYKTKLLPSYYEDGDDAWECILTC